MTAFIQRRCSSRPRALGRTLPEPSCPQCLVGAARPGFPSQGLFWVQCQLGNGVRSPVQVQPPALTGCNCSSKPSARVEATGQDKGQPQLCNTPLSGGSLPCSTAAEPRGSQLFKPVLLICTGTEWPLFRAKENLCSCRGSWGWGLDLGWLARLALACLVDLGITPVADPALALLSYGF